MDATYHYLVCSHDGLDPEEVSQVAESKCLASAAKLGGVTVSIQQKTISSLTGSDSSEVAEIVPFKKDVHCEWTDRFLETVGNGFRVWLRCRVPKNAIVGNFQEAKHSNSLGQKVVGQLPYKRGTLLLSTVPRADKIIVTNLLSGERVIEPTASSVQIELREGDTILEVRKRKYQAFKLDLKTWSHGETMTETSELVPES